MTELRPFRFGVHTSDAADGAAWAAAARRYEELGFSTLMLRDHFDQQLAPIAAMTAAACATETLRVGCLVFANDYRHPVVLAKELATTLSLHDALPHKRGRLRPLSAHNLAIFSELAL